ncbi:MAG: permease [Alphaproteobacteria bacterium]|nr:permease [Alphaproteobacteria bacterium]
MAHPTSHTWFARHELGLFWRDWLSMMTAGKRGKELLLASVLAAMALGAHWIASAIIGVWAADGVAMTKANLVMLSGGGILFFTLMLSQAMESVTRAYYARSDLDLILSSPASSRRLFAIRTGAIGVSTLMLSGLIAGPFINMLAVREGWHWLAAYGVMACLAAFATALAVLGVITLFRTVGPKRARLISQIIAAVVGAGFIIGIQAVAIIYYGSLSRLDVLQSPELIANAPDVSSWLWLPARAAMGDGAALVGLAIACFGLLGFVISLSSSSFGHHAVSAAGVSETKHLETRRGEGFRSMNPRKALRHKEWVLLKRDPWLISQTLMQILYLLPPAMMLWVYYGENSGFLVIIITVLVMASGQLAGGLAWLAISGEDAHDLVTTAPVSERALVWAKVEAVMSIIAVVVSPFILAMAFVSVRTAVVAAVGVFLSAASATAIQLWFRVQAKRTLFRRRQISSRTATLGEAFASIMWAGTAGLAAGGSWLAVMPAFLALCIMLAMKVVAPKEV